MADQKLKDKIQEVLTRVYFHHPGDYVTVSDADGGDVRVLVVSPQFRGQRAKQKRDLVWGALFAELTQPEWGLVSTLVAKSPEEVMAE